MGLRRSIVASLAIAGALACGGGGGVSVDPVWAAYKEPIQKILLDYDTTMNDIATIDMALIDLTGGGQPKITTDVAVEQIKKVVIPKLANVANSAAQISTPKFPHLTAAHAPLVAGLTGKVEGYRGMVAAYDDRDARSFDAALQKLLAADAQIKQYRANFQQWSAQGYVPQNVAPPPASPAPGGAAPGASGGAPAPGQPGSLAPPLLIPAPQ